MRLGEISKPRIGKAYVHKQQEARTEAVINLYPLATLNIKGQKFLWWE